MTSLGFPDAAALVTSDLVEGGYSNDPTDPGGETNHGITWPTLQEAIFRGIVPKDTTIATLTRDQSFLIYKAIFWDRLDCDSIPYPIALVLFDTAVNQSPVWAAKELQRILGVVSDGAIGQATLEALKIAPVIQTVRALIKRRATFYLHEEPAQLSAVYGLGWINRLLDIQAEAILAAFK